MTPPKAHSSMVGSLGGDAEFGLGVRIDVGVAVDFDDGLVDRPRESEGSREGGVDGEAVAVATRESGSGQREAQRREPLDLALADDLTIDEQLADTTVISGAREP